MKEIEIQYFWAKSSLSESEFTSHSGAKIKVLDRGEWNHNSGPDFINSSIEIDGEVWFGCIEIHIKSSDYLKHGHQYDSAYKNVILHVVFENDVDLKLDFQTIEIKSEISRLNVNEFNTTHHEKEHSHLSNLLSKLNHENVEVLAMRRLERKSKEIEKYLTETKNDWQEVFFRLLSKNFGFKTNAIPFEWLARSISFSLVRKYTGEISNMEALFFGQADLLPLTSKDEYQKRLSMNYERIKIKHSLKHIDRNTWKFLRMRPMNFPTIKIAQLSSIFCKNQSLAADVISSKNIHEAKSLFQSEASDYWRNHYHFYQESKECRKSIGEINKENVLINTVIPFKYTFSKVHAEKNFNLKTLSLLAEISPEKNSLCQKMSKMGYSIDNALQTQALLELKSLGKV